MHTDIFTYFTRANGRTELLYSAESWVKIRIRLETAGPVGVSTRQEIAPVLSGKSMLLTTDEEETFTLPKGDRFFIIAETVNRVKFIVEPVPWQEQIFHAVQSGFKTANGLLGRVVRGVGMKKP